MQSLFSFFSHYIYFTGCLLLLPFWLVSYRLVDPIHRRGMLLGGGIFAVGAFFIEYFYAMHDYWHPAFILTGVPLEDLMYGFLFGGICSRPYTKHKHNKIHHKHIWFIVFSFIGTIATFLILVNFLGYNSIIAHIIPPCVVGVIIAYANHHNLQQQLVTAMIATAGTIIVFHILMIIHPNLFIDIWNLERLSGIFLFDIPIEEILFSFALGFGASLASDYISGYCCED